MTRREKCGGLGVLDSDFLRVLRGIFSALSAVQAFDRMQAFHCAGLASAEVPFNL